MRWYGRLARLTMVEQLAIAAGEGTGYHLFACTLSFSRHDHRSASQFDNLVIYIVDWYRIRGNGVLEFGAAAYSTVTFAWRNREVSLIEWQFGATAAGRRRRACDRVIEAMFGALSFHHSLTRASRRKRLHDKITK